MSEFTINVEMDEEELSEILFEGKEFQWTFQTEEDEKVKITVNITRS